MRKVYQTFILASATLVILALASAANGNGQPALPAAGGQDQNIWTRVAVFSGGGLYTTYGFSVDIGGDIAVVTDSHLTVDGQGHAGVVHVYERNEGTGGWVEVKLLTAPAPHQCGYFGAAVAVTESADTIIVGENGRRDHPACKQDGSIYFYGRDEGGVDNWGLFRVIDGAGAYGKPLRVDGDTLVVGVPGDMWDGGCDNGVVLRPEFIAGSVQIFKRDLGGFDNWGMLKEIDPPHLDDYDKHFGCSVAISGNRLAVGAPDYGETGMAYLYDGEQDWALVESHAGFQRWNTLGFAVAVSADDFFIAAPFEHRGAGYDFVGQVYPAGSSTPLPYPTIAPTGNWRYIVGTAMALDGEFLAVSYNGTNETEVHDDVLIYRNTNLGWELVQVLEDIGPECWSNMSIAMDGARLIVGETGCLGIGWAHIFERSDGGEENSVFLPTVIR